MSWSRGLSRHSIRGWVEGWRGHGQRPGGSLALSALLPWPLSSSACRFPSHACHADSVSVTGSAGPCERVFPKARALADIVPTVRTVPGNLARSHGHQDHLRAEDAQRPVPCPDLAPSPPADPC